MSKHPPIPSNDDINHSSDDIDNSLARTPDVPVEETNDDMPPSLTPNTPFVQPAQLTPNNQQQRNQVSPEANLSLTPHRKPVRSHRVLEYAENNSSPSGPRRSKREKYIVDRYQAGAT